MQGARPEFVKWNGRWVIATSDYGPGPNFVRFYDPAKLATAARTSDPGVLLAKVACGPWVQSMHYMEREKTLILVQNQTEGRRWRLTVVRDVEAKSFASGNHVKVIDLDPPTDELEGFVIVAGKLGIFVTSARENNVTFSVCP